jgi:hypothetical protein
MTVRPLMTTAAAAAFAALTPSTQAAIIAGYDFEDVTQTNPSSVVTTVASDVTATNFTIGPSGNTAANLSAVGDNTGSPVGSTSATNSFQLTGGSAWTGTSLSVSGGYVTFSVTPGSGKQLDLASLAFKASAPDLTKAPVNWAVFTSVGGFASTAAKVAEGTVTTALTADGAFQSFSVPLPDTDFPDQTSQFDVRIYWWGQAASGTRAMRIDKVVVNGEVVPEPASVGLLGLAALPLLRRRRIA